MTTESNQENSLVSLVKQESFIDKKASITEDIECLQIKLTDIEAKREIVEKELTVISQQIPSDLLTRYDTLRKEQDQLDKTHSDTQKMFNFLRGIETILENENSCRRNQTKVTQI